MSGEQLRPLFNRLIRHQVLKEKLIETSPNAFQEISIKSYPDSWFPPVPNKNEKQPKSLSDMEPFCLNWAEFDMKFQGKWDLIVSENTGPPPPEVLDLEGYREINEPPLNLDDYKHLPTLLCKKAQYFRFPRNVKQRLPFPVQHVEDEPSLHIKPWMLEPFPPTIDWSKQSYKGMGSKVVEPLYIRWNEYPVYQVDDVENADNRPPTLKELAIDYIDNKKMKGLCMIEEEPRPKTYADYQDEEEEKEKDEKYRKLLMGDLPDFWFQPKKEGEEQDEGHPDFEVIGNVKNKRKFTPADAGAFLGVNEFERDSPKYGPRDPKKAMSWSSRKRWHEEKRAEEMQIQGGDSYYDDKRGSYRGRSRSSRGSSFGERDSWSGKGAGATGWNRNKIPRTDMDSLQDLQE